MYMPSARNADASSQQEVAAASEKPIVHGRVRITRFAVAGLALVGMVGGAFLINGANNNSPLMNGADVTVASSDGKSIVDPAGPMAGQPAPAPVVRLGSSNSFETAVAVSQRAYPNGAQTVYLANANNPVDALPGGMLTDGPVLLVPPHGNVPPLIFDEIKRLSPGQVVILGGQGAVAEDVAGQIATFTGVSRIDRWYGATRIDTARVIAERAFPSGASTVYLADARGKDGKGSPDAVAAGVLTGGPVAVVDSTAQGIQTAAAVVSAMHPSKVVVLGGEAVVPSAVANQVAAGVAIERLAGPDRYATSREIAKSAFPGGAGTVYLTSGTSLTDALLAGAFSDGPILLVPNAPRNDMRTWVTLFGNPYVVAMGGLNQDVADVAAGFKDLNQVQTTTQAPVNGVSMGHYVYSQAPSAIDAAREEAVFNSINAERAARGLAPLVRDPAMDDVARAWAQRVASQGIAGFHHSSKTDLDYGRLIPPGWRLAGENMVGYYDMEPNSYGEGARNLWVNSPGHLANLARPVFNRTGIGVATGPDWVYCVQNFGQY